MLEKIAEDSERHNAIIENTGKSPRKLTVQPMSKEMKKITTY